MICNEDIIKGVRRGAILLAALLIGVATYRILHQMVADAEEAAPDVTAPVAEVAPALAPGPPTVPPPPPLPGEVRKLVRGHAARILAAQAIPAAPVAKVEERDATASEEAEGGGDQVDNPPDAAPEVVGRKEDAPPVLVQEDGGDSQKAPARRLRWLRAVGRFLHVVKGDGRVQAFR